MTSYMLPAESSLLGGTTEAANQTGGLATVGYFTEGPLQEGPWDLDNEEFVNFQGPWSQADFDFDFGGILTPPATQSLQPQVTDSRDDYVDFMNGDHTSFDHACSGGDTPLSIYNPSPETEGYSNMPVTPDVLLAGSSSSREMTNGADQTGGVVQAMPLVGQPTQEPLQLEDEGETIRPEHNNPTPVIGSSVGSYQTQWRMSPVLTRMANTAPIPRAIRPRSEKNLATSHCLADQGHDVPTASTSKVRGKRSRDQCEEEEAEKENDERALTARPTKSRKTATVKQTKVKPLASTMKGMDPKKREKLQSKVYHVKDLYSDFNKESDKIAASLRPTNEDVVCAFPECGGAMIKVKDIRTHLREVHSPKDYACSLCPKKANFQDESRLATHMYRKHFTVNYSCKLCCEGTTRDDTMSRHLLVRCKGLWGEPVVDKVVNGGKK
ncbi:hypothetical protein BDN72DRAFT_506800 [Pluteus cervinus]|uniref:Uncharacterized protein n=1 Tax=Pluteus cervinus TaxID=181527 RepID=A0ACD3A4P3_9AGAR|nr:hypothetical protein BDN72DRAFT_506800 [Pluteus cervinus]